MKNLREFYGETVIDNSDDNNFNIEFKIYLSYYKIQDCLNLNSEAGRYGIQVVKKQNEGKVTKMETKEYCNIVDSEEKVNNILELLKRNKVTPIGVYDVLEDMQIF